MSFNGISKLAGHIDISCVQAFHTKDEIDKMIRLAREHRFGLGINSVIGILDSMN